MTRLRIISISPASSVQDFGRSGAQRYGLTSSGAMDRLALATANVLVGAAQKNAAIEIGPLPAKFTMEGGDARLALAGAPRPISLGNQKISLNTSFILEAGKVLELGPARPGVFSYLAIEGGLSGEASFGSLSVTARAGIGSPYARPLEVGDSLEVRPADTARREQCIEIDAWLDGPIRVVLGPQEDYFSQEELEQFFASEWRVGLASDRMGYRLEGPVIKHQRGFNIISDGIVNGHIQIPGNGQPLVLLADRGTTGGYPKLGAIITADLGRFAQTAVGGKLTFLPINILDAQAEAIQFAKAIADLPERLQPLAPIITSETLLRANLTSGAIHALDSRSWGGFSSDEHGFKSG